MGTCGGVSVCAFRGVILPGGDAGWSTGVAAFQLKGKGRGEGEDNRAPPPKNCGARGGGGG